MHNLFLVYLSISTCFGRLYAHHQEKQLCFYDTCYLLFCMDDCLVCRVEWNFQWLINIFFSYWRYNPLWVCILQPSSGAIAYSRTRFLDHTKRRATVGRTPLDEWSVLRRDLYLTTHNTHNKHPCPRWDSNPRSQQASGRRPTPWTARLLGPAIDKYTKNKLCTNLVLFTKKMP